MKPLHRANDDFEYWLFEMDEALTRFLTKLPADIRQRLDFGPDSLNVLEAWLLSRYASTQEMLVAQEAEVVDGAARYVGETYRKAIGGKWEIRLGDPGYVYHGLPQLTGFSERPTPVCPHALTTATADRRVGTFLRTTLQNIRSRLHQGIEPPNR